ncbi:putative TIR-NBS-LRR resistance protein, partial [Trifolium pratense]
NESADIKNVVEHVTLDRTELFVAEHPVGVESRVQAATKLLNTQNSEDVLLLGIWGMGGNGGRQELLYRNRYFVMFTRQHSRYAT